MKSYVIFFLLLFALTLILCGCSLSAPPPQNPSETGDVSLDIISFSFRYTTSVATDCFHFELTRTESGTNFRAKELFSGGRFADAEVDGDILTQLGKLAGTHRVDRWDGFDKSSSLVMDGSSFRLDITLADGSTISARGDNNFPDGYSEFSAAVLNLYDRLMEEHGIFKLDTSSPTAPEPELSPETQELAAFRSGITDGSARVAVAYLGCVELTGYEDLTVYLEANGFYELYPFLSALTEDQFLRQQSGELYAVIPASNDTSLGIYTCTVDETNYTTVPGDELLLLESGQPVILQGNISEIVPAFWVAAETPGAEPFDCTPHLSLMNGRLSVTPGIYDCSDYDLLAALGYCSSEKSTPLFFGTWSALARYHGWQYDLSLLENGECLLAISQSGEELACYEGWWFLDNDYYISLTLSLSSGRHPESPEWESISGYYLAEVSGSIMDLSFLSGDILTLNMEEDRHEIFSQISAGRCVSVLPAEEAPADWSVGDRVIADDTAPSIDAVFCALVPVENFAVVSLLLQETVENGTDPQFSVTKLYEHGTLTPDQPLNVTLTVYGAIPTYGVSFTDPNGTERLFGVTVSGKDGSLVLTEIRQSLS